MGRSMLRPYFCRRLLRQRAQPEFIAGKNGLRWSRDGCATVELKGLEFAERYGYGTPSGAHGRREAAEQTH